MAIDVIEVPMVSGILAVFDGRVLEFFASHNEGGTRIHVTQLIVTVSGPDKKGRHDVLFKSLEPHGGPYYQTGFFRFDDTELGAIQPLLDALKAAGVDVTSA